MGPGQIGLLTKAFSLFHKLGLSISLFLRKDIASGTTSEVRRELALAYSELVQITSHVNAHYRVQAYGTCNFNIPSGLQSSTSSMHSQEVLCLPVASRN